MKSNESLNRSLFVTELVEDANGKIVEICIEKTNLFSGFYNMLDNSEYCKMEEVEVEVEVEDEEEDDTYTDYVTKWNVIDGRTTTTYDTEEEATEDWFETNYRRFMECDHFSTSFSLDELAEWVKELLSDKGVKLSKIKSLDDIDEKYGIAFDLSGITESELLEGLKK